MHENARDSARADIGVSGVHTETSERKLAQVAPSASSAQSADRSVDEAWRQEVVSRVRRHRARRHGYDPAATMSLDFPPDEVPAVLQRVEATMPQLVVRPEPPKLIQFPRPLAEPTISSARTSLLIDDLELAAPVLDTPRILYAAEPEQMDLLSSFADIQLEAEVPRIHNAMDLPPQAAALRPRMIAGLVDSGIVLAAGLVFAMTFLAFAGMPAQRNLTLLSVAATGSCLWFLFQCIFLVYGQATPGMRMAELELCTFAGEQVSLMGRAGRAMASTLSAVSLGLGFAWALVDEDRLGWHDRMTQTHLRKAIGN